MDDNIKYKTIQILHDKLRSWEERERRAAINGLITVKSTSSTEAVRSTRATFADQYHSWLDRKLRDLSGSDKRESDRIQKELENLREHLRKLEAKVEILEAKGKLSDK